ncbi:gp53-like domain-containing protein [Enterobacter cloacae complex sp. 397G4]|uniref:gp53-like domain-containing protein n=1 Tax=unclassified Enterobacter cloacae complex TaxID=2757714 RepID=UPI003CF6E5D8
MGEGAKLPAATGTLATPGWITLPLSGGRDLIIQWGIVTNGGSGTAGNAQLPIAFPKYFLGGAFGPFDTSNGGFSVSFATRSLTEFAAVFRDVSNAPYPHIPVRLQSSSYIAIGF